jgi:hypothetical protein
MPFISHFLYPWGLILQALAIVHFIRRRPAGYWVCVILALGPIGALIYLCFEALPDIGSLGRSFKFFSRRKRIALLKILILDNPSAGNYEELGDLYLDDRKLQLARDAYDKAILARSDTPDSFYRRGVCAIQLGDAAAAIPDLELVVRKDPNFDFRRAAGLLAHAYALIGERKKAEALFTTVTLSSTSSETYLNFAALLASEGRHREAREMAQRVLNKKPTMPGYLRRRERPWFRSANALLKRLPA